MSTSTVLRLAFRCNKCWQMTCADSDQVGTSVPCVCCSTPVVVPDATPESLKAGEEFAPTSDAHLQPQIDLNEEISAEQIVQMARENVLAETRANGSPETMVCSRWKRLLGAIIDTIAAFAAVMVGLLVAMLLGAADGTSGDADASALVIFLIPAMLGICQCYMIAVDGRTIGKYCVKSKIVNLNGQPPGFFQGIVMRIVVVGFLGMIPFFGLINACWIFNPPKRCLHDHIAGTYVIDA